MSYCFEQNIRRLELVILSPPVGTIRPIPLREIFEVPLSP